MWLNSVFTLLCFYNLVEIRTGISGAVCTCVFACAHMDMHMLCRWMLLEELRLQGRRRGEQALRFPRN